MGWETANIHLGTPAVRKQVRQYLDRLKANWLSASAKSMATAVARDWRAWKREAAA
jgi:hypothetical protein